MNLGDCEHYADGCSKGHANGKPTEKHCAVCPDYKGPVRGAGDMIDKFTKLTGIKSLMKKARPSCGCEERRRKLNELLPRKA